VAPSSLSGSKATQNSQAIFSIMDNANLRKDSEHTKGQIEAKTTASYKYFQRVNILK
jgi:hypothetical protein